MQNARRCYTVAPVDKPYVQLRATCGLQAMGWAALVYEATFTYGCHSLKSEVFYNSWKFFYLDSLNCLYPLQFVITLTVGITLVDRAMKTSDIRIFLLTLKNTSINEKNFKC